MAGAASAAGRLDHETEEENIMDGSAIKVGAGIVEKSLDDLAAEIKKTLERAYVTEQKAGNLRLAAGKMLLEARRIIDAGRAASKAAQEPCKITWQSWLSDNFEHHRGDVRKLLALAGSPDPEAAHEEEKAAARDGMRRLRAKRANVSAPAGVNVKEDDVGREIRAHIAAGEKYFDLGEECAASISSLIKEQNIDQEPPPERELKSVRAARREAAERKHNIYAAFMVRADQAREFAFLHPEMEMTADAVKIADYVATTWRNLFLKMEKMAVAPALPDDAPQAGEVDELLS